MNSLDSLLDWAGEKLGLNVRYFVASGSWVAARYILLGLLSLALSVAFARLGGKELYGEYQFSLAVVGFLSFLSLPGLNTVGLRAVASGKLGVLVSATRASFRISFLMSLIVALVGVYYLTSRGHVAVGWSLVAASILLPFFYGPNGWIAYYEGRLNFHAPTKRILLLNALLALFLLAGLWKHWPLPALVVGYYLVNASLTTAFYREVRKRIRDKVPKNVDLKAGALYTLQKFSSTVPDTAQPFVISTLFGYGALGIFMVAYTLANSASGLMGALAATYFPLLIKYARLSHLRIVLQNVVLGVLLAGAYWLFITVFFIPLYGMQFLDSFYLAQYFTGMVALLPLRLYLTNYFTAQTSGKIVTIANLVAFSIAIINFFLLTDFGLNEALIGYTYSLQISMVLILGVAYYRRVHKERMET